MNLKAYCKCKKCGAKANIDASNVLTSNPPMYGYVCPNCGERGYIFCDDSEVKYEFGK